MLEQKENEQLNEAESLLLKALNKVQERYLSQNYNRQRTSNCQRIESVFSHELYHRFRVLQNLNNNILQNLRIDFDLPKHSYLIQNIDCLRGLGNKIFKPDLVVHKNQNKLSQQLLIGEIKMQGADFPSILFDLQKLIFYKVSTLKFENAFFIYTGEKEKLEEKLVVGLSSCISSCLVKNNICVATRVKNDSKKLQWRIFEFK